MADKDFTEEFEKRVGAELRGFLTRTGVLDERVPECPDVEERWEAILHSYLPDGVREFAGYPVVSLGWMMFVGMAMAFYWDIDWEDYSTHADIYGELRGLRGFDNLDEAIVEDVLGYRGEDAARVTAIAADCAQRVLSIMNHSGIEGGTATALACYKAALHQLYLAGVGMELNALGYHMRPLGG